MAHADATASLASAFALPPPPVPLDADLPVFALPALEDAVSAATPAAAAAGDGGDEGTGEETAGGAAGGSKRSKNARVEVFTATELAQDDDIMTSVLVDNALGFQTHKMGLDFEPIPVNTTQVP